MFNIETGYKNELLNMTKALGMTDSILFTGFHENGQDHINAMGILVHAYIHPEPFGLVICEGMALRKTVIATDAGAPQEIITDPRIMLSRTEAIRQSWSVSNILFNAKMILK